MAWGKAKPSHPPSAFSQVLPLLIVLVILASIAFVGYHIYLSATKIQAQASKNMGSKNVVFTKDGLRVGVKHVENEKYVDATQSWVVKAWKLHNSSATQAADMRRQSKSK